MKIFEHDGQVIVVDKIESVSRVTGDEYYREFVIRSMSGKEYTFGTGIKEDEDDPSKQNIKPDYEALEALRHSVIRAIKGAQQ